jgi:hypothetical protein
MVKTLGNLLPALVCAFVAFATPARLYAQPLAGAGTAVQRLTAWPDPDAPVENYNLFQLTRALDWAYFDRSTDIEWLGWADYMIGQLADGMNGGDNPMRWHKYPEQMSDAEFAALEKLIRDYWSHWFGWTPGFTNADDYIFLLWLRRINGGELYVYDEDNVWGYTVEQLSAQTTDALNQGLVDLVNWSNYLMVDEMEQAEWIRMLADEFRRRNEPVPANPYRP